VHGISCCATGQPHATHLGPADLILRGRSMERPALFGHVFFRSSLLVLFGCRHRVYLRERKWIFVFMVAPRQLVLPLFGVTPFFPSVRMSASGDMVVENSVDACVAIRLGKSCKPMMVTPILGHDFLVQLGSACIRPFPQTCYDRHRPFLLRDHYSSFQHVFCRFSTVGEINATLGMTIFHFTRGQFAEPCS